MLRFRLLNQLRQICNHVDLFRVRREGGGAGGRRGGSFRSNRAVDLDGSAKLRVLAEMLAEWRERRHRALVFSQTRMMLDIVENWCEQQGYRYIRIDGTTPSAHRQELIDRFNEDDTVFLALLTTRVGGVGVNLTGANRVVIFDPDWNPTTDTQARERAWRIGQTRDVCVYRLLTSGTVEEAMLRRQLAKTYVADKVLQDPHLERVLTQPETLVEGFFLGAEYDERVPVGKKHVLAPVELHTGLPRGPFSPVKRETLSEKGKPMEKGGTETEKKTMEAEFGELWAGDNDDDVEEEEEGGEGEGGDPSEDTALLRQIFDGSLEGISGGDAEVEHLARLHAERSLARLTNATEETRPRREEAS
ncbi:unnamed protein product [Phytomonas sp. EM1]|nr:unnamed protein product [Phytomonas sp. EM1]|eukprot:CCW64248.1 unnamed protein product [Phytomonas sp. isolate EM1]